jgi:hypothetical protein
MTSPRSNNMDTLLFYRRVLQMLHDISISGGGTVGSYNSWQVGKVDGTTKTILANTAKSVTVIVEAGTVTFGNGTQSSALPEGESITITATELFTNDIIIDGTSGIATWVMVTT